jgi:two-component system response regulator RegX3
MRVLLVEDDSEVTNELTRGLNEQGLDAFAVDRGRAALTHYNAADIVLLDLGLPDIDGFEVCRLIRANSSVPIIIVSGRNDEFDRVLGLKMGADDYVVKPYRLRELAARIEAVVRRTRVASSAGVADSVRELGRLRIDLRLRKVVVDGREVVLTRKEFDLLTLLASEPDRTFTRDQIMNEVWGHDGAGDTRTLGVHMAGLRRKLGVADLIETVRGVGFRVTN